MLKAPTGSGKSFVQVELLRRFPDLVQIVPTVEIGGGLWSKMTGRSAADLSEAALRRVTEGARIYTAKRYLNLLLSAAVPLPKKLSFDESHHTTDDTHSTLHAITGLAPRVGLTATDYRGTPQETKKLHDSWPVRIPLLSIPEAIERKVIARPTFETWPLLNDDTIDVQNGEFKVSSVDGAVAEKLPDIAARIAERFLSDRRATMVRLSSVKQIEMVRDALAPEHCPSVTVTAKSTKQERDRAFAECVSESSVLLQINVVSEGVDLPIRRLIDLAPTMSPRLWVQMLGRATRPTDRAPEYICCCYNLTRHAYLWEGAIPVISIVENQTAFGDRKPSRKSLARALGFDGFGRFVVNEVQLTNGLRVSLYAFQQRDGLRQFAVVLHPAVAEPYYFQKVNALTGEKGTFTKPDGTVVTFNKKTYGPWERIDGLPDVQGCVSIPEDRITEPMATKWKELAGRYGIDPEQEPTGRTFQLLPIAWNTKVRFLT